tara:strand:- start:172 stop:480 length:309 start_codon:yes stop_codon:yes gene_type:complete
MSTLDKEKKLSKRIDVALAKKDIKKTFKKTDSLNIYYRVGTELLAGLIIGAGIGWTLDQWVNTTPLLLIIFFILGGVAGIYNLWRVLTGKGLKMGFFNEKDK